MKHGLLIPFLMAAGSVAGNAQTAPPPSFAKTVVPVLRKAGCPACHNHDGVASGTRVIFPEADASAAETGPIRTIAAGRRRPLCA